MTSSLLRRACVAAALIAWSGASTAGVSAQTPSVVLPVAVPPVPITINKCTVLQATVTPTHPFWWPFVPSVPINVPITDGVEIAYTNKAPLIANRVLFEVNYRGDRQRIVDVGTFAPNAPIDHTFGAISGDAFLGPNPDACVVLAVRFTDGTFWRRVGP
ncbi:MAG: hypothetical protein JWO66_286 [Candidatus Eremiobacteraeota bacterium]|jgi:hypothetical protein|nr:hypothetical protein [Candidatus Eremiobacteraeota bacterium]